MTLPDVDAPTYTDEENERLSENLTRVAEAVHRGTLRPRRLQVDLLLDLHRALFDGVRSHAGRPRGPGFGSEVLRFGPQYSVHRTKVVAELDRLFHWLRLSVDSLEANRDDEEYALASFRVAARAHVGVVRIHPFEDGNGRSSRLLLDAVLVRLGFRPVSFDVVRAEYIGALEAAFGGDDEPLVDLCIRLASDALP